MPTLFRRKFVDIRDRFRTEPMTVARVYLDADEGAIASDLDAVVAEQRNGHQLRKQARLAAFDRVPQAADGAPRRGTEFDGPH